LDALEVHGKLSVQDVTELIGVSEATVRRLFGKLEEEGIVLRTIGGIRLVESNSTPYSFKDSLRRMIREKAAIGKRAALEVSDDDQIFLDSGTTVMAMAKVLARRMQTHEIQGLRVVTNSLIIADQLSALCKVIFVGGEIRAERKDGCGFLAEELMKKLHIKKAFLSCDALNFENGLMTTDERTSRMNEIIIRNASKIYVLADAQKIGSVSFVSYGRLADINTLVVDDSIDDENFFRLKESIPQIIIAPSTLKTKENVISPHFSQDY
jgi:DeoR/GlpR family transcriptional regulator of sugar metabolism